jgi:hypothetical protein
VIPAWPVHKARRDSPDPRVTLVIRVPKVRKATLDLKVRKVHSVPLARRDQSAHKVRLVRKVMLARRDRSDLKVQREPDSSFRALYRATKICRCPVSPVTHG